MEPAEGLLMEGGVLVTADSSWDRQVGGRSVTQLLHTRGAGWSTWSLGRLGPAGPSSPTGTSVKRGGRTSPVSLARATGALSRGRTGGTLGIRGLSSSCPGGQVRPPETPWGSRWPSIPLGSPHLRCCQAGDATRASSGCWAQVASCTHPSSQLCSCYHVRFFF